MRVPISLLVFGAAVLGVVPLHAQRPDSDLQAKARELLRQKMVELDSQQSAASNAPVTPPQQLQPPAQQGAVTPSQPPVVPAAEVPPSTPTAAVTTPAPASNAQAKAQKKSRKKKTKPDSKQPEAVKAVQTGSATPVASISTPVADAPEGLPIAPSSGTLAPPAEMLAPPAVSAAPPSGTLALPPGMSPSGTLALPLGMPQSNRDSQARAEEALRQKMAELDAEQRAHTPLPGAGQVNPAKQPKATPTYPIADVPSLAVTPPPPAIPDSKQARLADLLQLYKADKLTPLEYHTQRAKILSEP